MLSRRDMLRMTAALAAVKGASGATSHVRAGCQTNAWDLDPSRFETLLGALNDIRDMGFAGFETHLRYLQPQMNRQEEARAEIASRELVFIGVHTNLPKYEQLGEERAVDDAGRLAMAAKQFAAKTLILNRTGPVADDISDAKAKFLDAAAKRCREMGVILTYHTLAAEAAALVEKTDPKSVYFMLDLDAAGLDFFKDHPGRVYAVHMQDADPVRELASAVRRAKWISWLVHEEGEPKQGKAGAETSRAAIKKMFGV
jgi:inosose dehydratase